MLPTALRVVAERSARIPTGELNRLLSDAASYVTGAVVGIDGGMGMGL